MTKAYLKQSGDWYVVGCKGHATGNPAVCAAVSCLIYTIAGWAYNAWGVRLVAERLDAGTALLMFYGEGSRTVFDLAAVGFLQLEQQNPAFLSVEVRESG